MRTPLVAFRSGSLRYRIEAGADPGVGQGNRSASVGAIAKRDLAMYYALLAEEVQRIELEPDEVAVVITVVDPTPRDILHLSGGSAENPLGSFTSGEPRLYLDHLVRWQAIDLEKTAAGPARTGLLDKIEAWSDFRAQSVIEAVTQYVNLADRSLAPWDARMLAQAGLLRRPYPDPSPEVVDALMETFRALRTTPGENGLLLPRRGRRSRGRATKRMSRHR